MSAKEDLLRLAEKVEETGRANWVRGFRDNLAFEIRTIANAMPAEGGEAARGGVVRVCHLREDADHGL